MSLSAECDRTSQIIPLNIHAQVREYNLCIFKYLTTGSIKKIQTKTSEFVVLARDGRQLWAEIEGWREVWLQSSLCTFQQRGRRVNRKLPRRAGRGRAAQDPIMFAQYYNRSGPGPRWQIQRDDHGERLHTGFPPGTSRNLTDLIKLFHRKIKSPAALAAPSGDPGTLLPYRCWCWVSSLSHVVTALADVCSRDCSNSGGRDRH